MKKVLSLLFLLSSLLFIPACDQGSPLDDMIKLSEDMFSGESEEKTPAAGFADIHNHQMAEYAYAGAWFHGSHRGPEEVAMGRCKGFDDHARTILGPLNEFLALKPGTQGDTGWHFGKRNGYPVYDGWPRWDTIAHQQMWEGHLKEAHESGLSLSIMSAVNFRPLCELMPEKNRHEGANCNDHDTIDIQLQAAIDFASQRDWVEIAHSPGDARRIIKEGKLAMILAIEISDLFPSGDWEEQLDHYYNEYGVRSIQLAHQLDNRFSGAAPHHFIFKFFQFIEDLKGEQWTSLGFDLDGDGHNTMGLTEEGKAFVRAMMERNMIIDMAHLPERSVATIYEIAKEYSYYPLIMSHGHFRSMMMEEKQKEEKTTPDWIVKIIRETGGIFGIRTGSEEVKTYEFSGVANDCDGSTKSFAQVYQFAVNGPKVNVAFASDMNGFIQQLRPRFGSNQEPCGASGDRETVNSQKDLQTMPLGTGFDNNGFAHIGLIEDIIRDLNNFNVDTTVIENSSETTIQVWERCYDDDRQPVDVSNFDTSGIH